MYVGCPFRLGVVKGDSMSPTVTNGSFYLLDRAYYRSHSVQVGDIIVFRHGNDIFTKRVYGAPGETIQLVRYADDGTFEVTTPRWATRVQAMGTLMKRREHRRPACTVVNMGLPSDRCFVVGDNYTGSCDSRQFGPIDTATILGKVVAYSPPTPAAKR